MKMMITLNDEQAAVLSLDMPDVKDWLQNAVAAKAEAVLYRLQSHPDYGAVMQVASTAGVDLASAGAVVAHGLSVGLLKTAEVREAERIAEEAAEADAEAKAAEKEAAFLAKAEESAAADRAAAKEQADAELYARVQRMVAAELAKQGKSAK